MGEQHCGLGKIGTLGDVGVIWVKIVSDNAVVGEVGMGDEDSINLVLMYGRNPKRWVKRPMGEEGGR